MADLQKPIILVIDDDDDVRDSLKVLLETHGFEVIDFASGRSFLARHDCTSAGCVLLDVHMPTMSGIDVLKAMRDAGDLTPVVLITGKNDFMVQSKVASYEVIAVLDKPIAHPLLFAAIDRALSRLSG